MYTQFYTNNTSFPFLHCVAQEVASCIAASVAAKDEQSFLHSKYRCGFYFFLNMLKGNEWGSQIKLLYTKVQLNSEGALLFQPAEAYWLRCAQPLCTKRWLLFFSCVILPPLVCLNSDATFLCLFSHVQLASELCLSSDRYSSICTVLSLG